MPKFDPTSASHAVLVEVLNVLGAFRDEIVLVGGWVPDLLYPHRGHMGSLDVDLAVSRKSLDPNVYQTILQRMLKANYSHHTSPTHFTKSVPGVAEPVKVDLVAGQYEGARRSRTIQVNELELNTLRGLDLAFEFWQEIEISGDMPNGIHNTVRARMVRPEGYILIKAFALDERTNSKDTYDIDFVLRHFPPNIEALADRVRPLLPNGLAREGYTILKAKFATLGSVGPSWAAEVATEQGEDFEQSRRAAFEYAQALFEATETGGRPVE